LILGGSYSYIFNNQKIKNSRDYWLLRINAETAGNLIGLAEKLAGGNKTDNTYQILGQPFAQYAKTDLDLRYNYKFNDVSSIAYRGFFGIALPYGNSKEIPFEKQYFEGGANDIRAWQLRSLGPGSYADSSRLLNETGDIKLEANAEYRYKLFWIIEGAIFLDAGNIWSYKNDLARPGSQFQFNKFYKDIAIGTGTGFRFDLKYIIARVDLGMKLRDPLLHDAQFTEGSHWIFLNGPYKRKDFTIVLGIGYPF
jgi:outer membrane protein assembly factor BamA